MAQTKQGKNYCIKLINGNPYLYTWRYRPTYLRTKRKSHRFQWKYIGNYNNKLVQKRIRKLPSEEQEKLHLAYLEKLQEYELEQRLIQELMTEEPHKSELARIARINNRQNHQQEMNKYNQNLRKVFMQYKSKQHKNTL
ncbi:hypothetical protein [Psychrobacillus sp. FSL H8-0487]|uniref:hypothetical protein n=1 Tax=Psychrobacillus sp. FSL H8-0487 TaxID=2921391 RepID=UPI0030F996F9